MTSAEPAISSAVTSIIRAHGCEIERFATRLKSLNSLDRKVQTQKVRFGGDADDVVRGIGDVIRYTAVVPDSGYWARGTQIINALIRAGYWPNGLSDGWDKSSYRGRNCTFFGPTGIEFEVQFHTRDSLAAAEESHADYEVYRDDAVRDDVRRAEAKLRLDARFALVPAPNDVRWVDL